MIFRGTFEYALDAKHRLTVPSKYRMAFAGGVVVALSPETQPGSEHRSLSIWPSEAYASYAQAALAGVNPLSPTGHDLRHMLFNRSWDLELDSAGRVMIPPSALPFAKLTKDVVVTGSGICLEVWDRVTYASYSEAVLARFPEIAASFDHTG